MTLELKNKLGVTIWTESGCSFKDGEFTVKISNIIEGEVGHDDHQLVRECVWEEYENSDFPQLDAAYYVELVETGEWEDVFWHKYYQIADGSKLEMLPFAEDE
jgi:hypothetical protein